MMKSRNESSLKIRSTKPLSIAVAAVLLMALCATTWASQNIALAWSPNRPDVAGYKIYYGPASRTYTNSLDVGNTTNTTLSGLTEGTTYFLAATAYNASGFESDYSVEASYSIPSSTPNQPPTLNTLGNLTLNENAGTKTVNLSGISSGSANETQTLLVSAISSNPGLIPNPTVSYASANASGSLTFTPSPNANGTATITVTVTDGGPSNNIVTRAFTVTILPYIPAKGTYTGLFHENDGVRLQSAGFLTVATTALGDYSGRLQIGDSSYTYSGKLNAQCQATNLIFRTGARSLTLELRFGKGMETNQLFGRVTDGIWTAALTGDRAVFNSSTNPAPYAGKYTLVIPGWENDPSLPLGDGYATVQVNTSGQATFAGVLTDGTKFSQIVPLSKGGFCPLYASLYSGKGSVMSWIAFTNLPGSDINGTLNWIKPTNSSALYRAGFNNTSEVIGSAYVQPAVSTVHILNLTNAAVAFSGGNLAAAFTNLVTLGSNSKVINLSNNKLTMNFTLTTGTFSGSATEATTGRIISFTGVVLQKLHTGHGRFLGTNQCGRVSLTP